MKKIIAMLLVLSIVLSFTACFASSSGGSQSYQNDAEEGDTTLSPREQYEKQKQEAESILNSMTADPMDGAEPVTYTTNGLTYTLDTSFSTPTTAEDNFQHAYYNGTMYVTEQKQANYFGIYTARELVEELASQKDSRVVRQANNGVYYIEDASAGSISAYYVNDSGYYWILFSTCSQFDTYRDLMIQYCTSGKLN